jgi:hypothetical protein
MTEFFEGNVGSGTFAPRRKVTHKSKRLSKAMANLKRKGDEDDDVQEIAPRKMLTKRKRPAATEVIKVESDEEEHEMSDQDTSSGSSSEEDRPKRRKVKRRVGAGKSGKRKIR